MHALLNQNRAVSGKLGSYTGLSSTNAGRRELSFFFAFLPQSSRLLLTAVYSRLMHDLPHMQARLAAEEKRIRFEQQQQGAAASQVEETSFASLIAGQARELVQRQRSSKQDALQYEATKTKATAVRMKSVKQDLKGKADFIKAYDQSMQQLRGSDQQAKQQDLLRKKGLVETQHDFENRLLQSHKEKAYVPGSSTEGPAAALLKQLSLGVLASEASLSVKQ